MELKGSRMGFNLFNRKVTLRKLCETLRKTLRNFAVK
jgi:hypothetical protein